MPAHTLHARCEPLNAELFAQGSVAQRGTGLRLPLTVGTAVGDSPETLLVGASSPTELGGRLIDELADRLASRFAATGGGTFTLTVVGVNSAQRYMDLLRYLQSLSFLDGIDVLESEPAQLLLRLDSQAGLEQFVDLLGVDGRLVPELDGESAPALGSGVFGAPVFTWRG